LRLAQADARFKCENEKKERAKLELVNARRELAETLREEENWNKRLRAGIVEDFDENSVCNLLREIGLAHAVPKFEQRKINGEVRFIEHI